MNRTVLTTSTMCYWPVCIEALIDTVNNVASVLPCIHNNRQTGAINNVDPTGSYSCVSYGLKSRSKRLGDRKLTGSSHNSFLVIYVVVRVHPYRPGDSTHCYSALTERKQRRIQLSGTFFLLSPSDNESRTSFGEPQYSLLVRFHSKHVLQVDPQRAKAKYRQTD